MASCLLFVMAKMARPVDHRLFPRRDLLAEIDRWLDLSSFLAGRRGHLGPSAAGLLKDAFGGAFAILTTAWSAITA